MCSHVYRHDGFPIERSILCLNPDFQSNSTESQRPVIWDRRYVLVLWLGMHCLAGICPSIWQEACILDIYGRIGHNHGLCTTLYNKWTISCQQDPSGRIPHNFSPGRSYSHLQGFFGAPVESLCEISMTNIVSFLFLLIYIKLTEAVVFS